MSLSILNNISALTAQNSMSTTQANLQKTLTQLSTGMRINSGADDAAGLSIANGMTGNIAALTQSGQNATNTVGLLQTADGALSQVTSLLNRAVTLATEASSNGLSGTQTSALNTEFASIVSSINNIGKNTNFNGSQVFTTAAVTPFLSDGTSGNDMLGGATMSVGTLTSGGLSIGQTAASNTLTLPANPAANNTVAVGGTTYKFVAALSTGPTVPNEVLIGANTAESLQNLGAAVNGGGGIGTSYSTGTVTNANVQASSVGASSVTFTAVTAGTGGNALASVAVGGGTWSGTATLSGGAGTLVDLNSVSNAKAALVAITSAINTVSQSRGSLGASINQLTAASNVMTSQVQNLQSADNGIMNADIGKTVANMTQYNILQSTGMAALQQSNQAQQAVLKLVQ
jgi:flagellin